MEASRNAYKNNRNLDVKWIKQNKYSNFQNQMNGSKNNIEMRWILISTTNTKLKCQKIKLLITKQLQIKKS